MPHEQALPADIVAATEMRAFSRADERQVQTFDEEGNANKVSDIKLYEEFIAAADKSFIPAPTNHQTLNLV